MINYCPMSQLLRCIGPLPEILFKMNFQLREYKKALFKEDVILTEDSLNFHYDVLVKIKLSDKE